jgi:hypothetical protein
MLLDTRIYLFRGSDFNRVFEIFDHFLYQGGQDYSIDSSRTFQQMLLDTRNKDIYGLGVGISTVFEIFGHFL